MECFKCKSINPENQSYCGNCGTFLDPSISIVDAYLQTNLCLQMEVILKEIF